MKNVVKILVSFETIMWFWCPLRFRIFRNILVHSILWKDTYTFIVWPLSTIITFGTDKRTSQLLDWISLGANSVKIIDLLDFRRNKLSLRDIPFSLLKTRWTVRVAVQWVAKLVLIVVQSKCVLFNFADMKEGTHTCFNF